MLRKIRTALALGTGLNALGFTTLTCANAVQNLIRGSENARSVTIATLVAAIGGGIGFVRNRKRGTDWLKSFAIGNAGVCSFFMVHGLKAYEKTPTLTYGFFCGGAACGLALAITFLKSPPPKR